MTEETKQKEVTQRQALFIASYLTNNGVKARAIRETGIPHPTVYWWFKNDETFQQAVKEAEDEWYDELAETARARAKEKSDTLAMFLLKSRDPETFDDAIRKLKWMRDNEFTGDQDVNIQIVGLDGKKAKPEESDPYSDQDD